MMHDPNNERFVHETCWLRCVLNLMAKVLQIHLRSAPLVAPVIQAIAQGQRCTYTQESNINLPEIAMALTKFITDNICFGDIAMITKDLVVFQHRYLNLRHGDQIRGDHYMTLAELNSWYADIKDRIDNISIW